MTGTDTQGKHGEERFKGQERSCSPCRRTRRSVWLEEYERSVWGAQMRSAGSGAINRSFGDPRKEFWFIVLTALGDGSC